jgi:hypothetical protein
MGEVGVAGAHTAPVALHNGREGGMEKPRVFHPKHHAARGFRGSREVERDMVRRGAGGGSEGAVREGKAPIRINKNSIEARQDGRILQVGPSELPVQQRDFNQTGVVYEVIEGGRLASIEIVIRLVAGRPNKIEITHDCDRPWNRGNDLFQGREKSRLKIMGAWPVHIYDRESKVVCAKGERGGNREVIDRVAE